MGKRREQLAANLVVRGNRKRLRALLRRHPELKTSKTASLIFTAIWQHRSMLRWLLERGVSPDSGSDFGFTPLMQAAAEGDLATIKLLLESGADPNALNNESENPLGYAVTWEQPAAIRLLVAAGADVNNTEDSGLGRTQLDWAELSQWTAVAEVLRELGGKRYTELSS